MKASVYIKLPFDLLVAEDEEFPIFTTTLGEYSVIYYPFERSPEIIKSYSHERIQLNERKGVRVDMMHFVIRKEEFNRLKNAELDPPIQFIEQIANDLIARLRYVTGSPKIKPIKLMETGCSLFYLDDEEKEIPKNDEYKNGYIIDTNTLEFVGYDSLVCQEVNKIGMFVSLPIWRTLLLDARYLMPEIGPALVLAYTALEVFISTTLDDMVKRRTTMPEKMWDWLNDSSRYLKAPSVAEQFDFLAKEIIGISLKGDKDLWKKFTEIRKARNSFAHTGIAKIDNNLVDELVANELITRTGEIIEYFKIHLPADLQWRDYRFERKVSITIPFSSKYTQGD